MAALILIKVSKPGVPAGAVLLEDAAALASGLHDVLARLVQYRLGDAGRGKLPEEAKRLTQVVLVGVSEGSGVMECRPLDEQFALRSPAILAASELVEGVRAYSESGEWPRYLPWVVRNRLGAAVAPVVKEGATASLHVAEDGQTFDCLIDDSVRTALQAADVVPADALVNLVGEIYDINVQARTFRIDVLTRKVKIPFDDSQRTRVDDLRWQRVFVSGLAEDARLRALAKMTELRAAEDDEEPGFVVPDELAAVKARPAYLAVAARLQEIRTLTENWDSYAAAAPRLGILDFSERFLGDVGRVFMDYGLELPVPFVVPTRRGNVQFEWAKDERELELEIVAPGEFHFLRALSQAELGEGTATRWEAIRFIKWLATGEQA